MRKYVYRRRMDGLAILNTLIVDKKLKNAIDFIVQYQPKDWILVCKREAGWRAVKMFSELTGVKIFTKKYPAGVITNTVLPDFFETKILNDGQINYTTRYIQREVSKLEQASLSLSERTYGYKSSVLWELGDQQETRTINQPTGNVGYALGAVPLGTSLGSVVPYVQNYEIKNNTIDVGESAFWLPRFQGYLFANGEIIRYDAQQYQVDSPSASATNGLVWITNNNEYQKYFSELVFNGKMVLTGLLRIYTEPYYENASGSNFENLEENVRYKNGEVRSHGRGQFGTNVTSHSAGLNPYWENSLNRRSFRMDSNNIFSTVPTEFLSYGEISASVSASVSASASVYAIVTNFWPVGPVLSMLNSGDPAIAIPNLHGAYGLLLSNPSCFLILGTALVSVFLNLLSDIISSISIIAASSSNNRESMCLTFTE
jgi:hypothetical protein